MKLNEIEKNLLIELFARCHEERKPISAKRFYADFNKHYSQIMEMITNGLIVGNPHDGTVRPSSWSTCLVDDKLVDSVVFNMSKLFYESRKHLIEHTNTPIALEDFANDCDLSVEDVVEAMLYLQDAEIINHNLTTPEKNKWLIPLTSILDFVDFDDLLENQKKQHAEDREAKEEPTKLRHNQLAKKIVQAIATMFWQIDRTFTITDIINSKPIQENADAARYSKKTLRRWVTEVDPRDANEKTGRPKRTELVETINSRLEVTAN